MSALFTPFTLKDVTLRNRVAVPPMCQYSARDGFVTEWHQAHYNALARGGAGLVIVEATGVLPEGRITPACLGLWDDAQAEGLARIAAAIRRRAQSPESRSVMPGARPTPTAHGRATTISAEAIRVSGRRSRLRRWPLAASCRAFRER